MSPMINPDTSQMVKMGPIEPGTYPAKIDAVTYKLSKAGNPMLEIVFNVNVDGEERPRTGYVVISGAGAFNFDQLLRATGFDALADQYADPDHVNPAFDTDELVGQTLNVVIDRNLYEGQARDNIKSYLKA